jgi:predicted membrane-bound spermidine synthase
LYAEKHDRDGSQGDNVVPSRAALLAKVAGPAPMTSNALVSPRGAAAKTLRTVFFFSGFASLIYQVVWQRLLTVYYGVGPVATTLIVSTFMLGLGLGALIGGALAERVCGRVRLYSLIEFLLGAFGIASPWLLDYVGARTAGASYPIALTCMAAFLCFPTLLMGMTLPLLVKIVNSLNHDFLGSISFLYFINTLGAAVGTLAASYFIISLFGLDTATYIAAAINLLLAFVILLIGRAERDIASTPLEQSAIDPAPLGRWAYLCVFLTGFLAVGYEIIWFRLLGVPLKDSPYVFSTILAVYLLGIALGSRWMTHYFERDRSMDRRSVFFLLQSLLGIYVLCTVAIYYWLGRSTWLGALLIRASFSQNYHPNTSNLSLRSVWSSIDPFLYPILFLFIPTLLMGASFPIINCLGLKRPDRDGSTVGTVYFFNILGNVAGGVLTGFWFLQRLGTEQTTLLFSLAGVAMFVLVRRVHGHSLSTGLRLAAIAGVTVFAILLFPGRGDLYRVIHGEQADLRAESSLPVEVFLNEGTDAVVATFHNSEVTRCFINGAGHGGRPGYLFYRESIEAIAYAQNCENVLVIGYGTGSIVDTVLRVPSVKKVTLVEISATLMENLTPLTPFREMMADPRVELIIDDGRRYLFRTTDDYDLILLDPLRTTTSHSNNIYSYEFFKLAGRHLAPGGVALVYCDEDRVLPKTLARAFEFNRLYDYFAVVSHDAFQRNDDREAALLQTFDDRTRQRILKRGKYLGDREYVESLTQNFPINRDWKPVCEYYFWRPLQLRAWQTP